ncbi:MAG: hypothetical protein D5R96_00790 [Methanocalculus sp. MSAO_Arc2]|uniref:DUF7524 family protein n=1 Tax=Methanocalculus sp. MSAO_Arc2 TaxID=2293855 RepID=UPI000FEE1212|nr:MAG: hypothetical protein D5R96_00790 [Methanocalculus sp. MSAO_Arc2]
MTVAEAHLNRIGVNSIELPIHEVPVDAGSDLVIHLKNHGSPTHATIRTHNGGAYTDFYHENIYVDGNVEFRIPIRESSGDGIFDLDVITGYGSKLSRLKVVVSKACPIVPLEEEVIVEEKQLKRTRPSFVSLILCIIAFVIYLVWLYFRWADLAPLDAIATALIVLLLLTGVITACRCPESS